LKFRKFLRFFEGHASNFSSASSLLAPTVQFHFDAARQTCPGLDADDAPRRPEGCAPNPMNINVQFEAARRRGWVLMKGRAAIVQIGDVFSG